MASWSKGAALRGFMLKGIRRQMAVIGGGSGSQLHLVRIPWYASHGTQKNGAQSMGHTMGHKEFNAGADSVRHGLAS